MHLEKTPPVKSTTFSFRLIEYLHDVGEATLSELTDEFSRPKSTIHDHVTTLVQLGYLTKDGGSFRISMRFLDLGGRARDRSLFFKIAKSEVRQLAADTGEHANLMVEENGRGVFLLKERGQRSVNLDTYEGREVALHTTAMGKIILAKMTAEKREQIIDRYGLESVTPNTITDRETLLNELSMIREQGYATDDEERLKGIRCVAAPVMGDNTVIGAVSVSAPRGRMTGERFEDTLPAELLSTANIIEINFQHA